MKVQFVETSLDDVLDYFVKGYNMPFHDMVHYDTFVDHVKGKVVIKMWLDEKPKELTDERE